MSSIYSNSISLSLYLTLTHSFHIDRQTRMHTYIYTYIDIHAHRQRPLPVEQLQGDGVPVVVGQQVESLPGQPQVGQQCLHQAGLLKHRVAVTPLGHGADTGRTRCRNALRLVQIANIGVAA